MSRHELTQEEVDAFRRRAVEAAEKLFGEDGLRSVTMRAVAQQLGCSAMTAYRYFADREALVSELRAMCFRRLSDDLESEVKGLRSPEKKLAAIRRAYVKHALTYPEGYRLMFSLDPPLTPHRGLQEQSQRSFAVLIQAMGAAVEQGEREGDPLTLAHLVWAELHGLVSLELSNKLNFGRSLEQLVRYSNRDGKEK